MSTTKISELPEATSLGDTAVAPWSSPTVTNKVTYQTLKKQILDLVYPVGSIFETTAYSTAAQVQAAFGGTWVAYGAGQVTVGYNSGDGNFNAVNKTGGGSTHQHSTGDHTLTVSEMPKHTHDTYPLAYNAGTRPDGNTSGWHRSAVDHNVTGETGGGGAHNHGNTGSSSSLQPYITVYRYRRTV